MKLSSLEVDVDRENEGTWVEWPEQPGVWAKVRSLYNPDFEQAQDVERRKTERMYRGKDAPKEVRDRVTARLFADHVLVETKGMELDNGKELHTNREEVIEKLTQQKYRLIRDFLMWAAMYVGRQAEQELEADGKNSETASSGKQAGGRTSEP